MDVVPVSFDPFCLRVLFVFDLYTHARARARTPTPTRAHLHIYSSSSLGLDYCRLSSCSYPAFPSSLFFLSLLRNISVYIPSSSSSSVAVCILLSLASFFVSPVCAVSSHLFLFSLLLLVSFLPSFDIARTVAAAVFPFLASPSTRQSHSRGSLPTISALVRVGCGSWPLLRLLLSDD